MKIVHSFSEIPPFRKPCGLTLGAFDGIHLGHQHLIHRLRQKISPKGTLGILTFRNHPNHVLKNKAQPPLLCTFEHKIKLLEKLGVDMLIVLPFTEETAKQTYEQFLREIKQFFPFSFFVLGKGASFGKGREGDEPRIKALQNTMGFEVEYVEKLIYQQEAISSARVRESIQRGDFSSASAMLGRPYSIYSFLQKTEDPTQGFMDVKGLCLPPEGMYFAHLYPNNLKNRNFNKADTPDLQQQIVAEEDHVRDTWPMETAAKMEMPAKLKTDSSSCLGIKYEDQKIPIQAYIDQKNNQIKIFSNNLKQFVQNFIEIIL